MSQQSEKRRRVSPRLSSRKEKLSMEPVEKETEKETREKEENEGENFEMNLEHLPPEVLEMVLKCLTYRELAGPVRLVSRTCASIATTILNAAFLKAKARLVSAMRHLEERGRASRKVYDAALYGRARDYLELILSKYDLLRAVTWRYTHPPVQQSFGRLCFYGGLILDEIDALVRLARDCPADLLDGDAPATCVANFGEMCKKFMNYFEKVSERRVNRSSLISGCKAIDLLDCLLEGRQVLSCKVTSGRGTSSRTAVTVRMRYVMKHSWFTCLELPSPESESEAADRVADEESWQDQQRFMYLRLRRLVGSVNEHRLERLHYERQLAFHSTDELSGPKAPPCSTYSGYGEFGGRFYYYGNMNEYAFDMKVIDTWRRNTLRDRMRRKIPEKKPSYALEISVELRCSPEVAPLAIRSNLGCDDSEALESTDSRKPEFYLKMVINCPGSVYNRLPGQYVWEIRSPRHLR